MADRPRFGPAGVPPIFKIMGAKLSDIPRLLREEGLDAFEYEAVRWGQNPQIRQEEARSLRAEARKNDVMLSMHGSYFVNLLGTKEIVEASKRRLVACATAAHWMGAYVVVFHLGAYGSLIRSEAFSGAVEALKDVIETLNKLGIEDVKLGPETMGKHGQFGSLDEIISLCAEVEQTQLVLDWSHLHARDLGRFRKVGDFRAVVEKIENSLGADAVENMHCHFTKIEFTDKGERRHHVLDEPGFGPDFTMLAETIIEFKLRPVIICETALLDIDAMKMRDILHNLTPN